ncbi:MAG: aldo/keto reductase [Gammaproteobacteria bacterium]|nr:aldo/keto reductase [Gammaproteobacteria bacterium]
MNNFSNEIKKKLAFGCMRLPMKDDEVDLDEFKLMVDEFISNGFNYFDTAHVYIGGKSETAMKECLVKRYDRSKYTVTNKLSSSTFKTEEDIIPVFNSQLEAMGLDYFDFYLMHAQSRNNYDHYKECHAYETAFKLKEMGKVKHVGLSFHDTPEFLDKILTEYPQIEVVQIQLNYLDFENPAIQSRRCYEVCVKHDKPVLIMEPVKGGSLVNLPLNANDVFASLNNGSNASYAIRFAASLPNVVMVLSGMSNLEQMKDNVSYMKDFKPLNKEEYAAIDKVVEIFKSQELIACTDCKYCMPGCPMHIQIPEIFKAYNSSLRFRDGDGKWQYRKMVQDGGAKATACIKCGKCENICPQHLSIRDYLVKAGDMFE